ncbi:hypothetical protein HYX00_01440 [Candidatus Woesearchaeota archaeon]|nr:hypothetical protein [Candidatus Woesearchaeota archaeon]
MIEQPLLQYGMAGIFIAYLIYDRQTILKKLISAIEENTKVTQELKIKLCSKRII